MNDQNHQQQMNQLFFAKHGINLVDMAIHYPFLRSIQILQTNTSHFSGISESFKTIYQKDGIRGFGRGFPAQLLYTICLLPISFSIFNQSQKKDENRKKLPDSVTYVVVKSLFHPFLVAQVHQATDLSSPTRKYSGLLDCLKKLYQKGGISQIYRGLLFSYVYQAFNMGLSFSYYSLVQPKSLEEHQRNLQIFSIFAFIITYPLIVTNMNYIQSGMSGNELIKEIPKFKGIIDCGKWIYQMNGVKGFYRGVIPYFIIYKALTMNNFPTLSQQKKE